MKNYLWFFLSHLPIGCCTMIESCDQAQAPWGDQRVHSSGVLCSQCTDSSVRLTSLRPPPDYYFPFPMFTKYPADMKSSENFDCFSLTLVLCVLQSLCLVNMCIHEVNNRRWPWCILLNRKLGS